MVVWASEGFKIAPVTLEFRKCWRLHLSMIPKRFCNMFYERSTFGLQLPCCPGQKGELAETFSQNLTHHVVPYTCTKMQ